MSTLDPQIRLCPSKSTASTIQGSYPPAFKICCPPVGDREPRKSRFTERKDDTRNAPIPIDHRVARIVTERPNRNLFQNHTDLTAQDIGAIGDNHEIPRFCLGIGRIIDRPEGYSGICTIPDSVEYIEWEAFLNCSSLTEVRIPKSIEYLDDETFSGCSSLSRFRVSSDNPYYKSLDGLLYDKEYPSLIKCPEGFSGSYTIPNSVINIDWDAFANCSSLTSVTIPDSVFEIAQETFAHCSDLTSVVIGSNVSSIGESAFLDCSHLTSVTIPDSVTFIDDDAFYGCTSLTSILLTDDAPANISSTAFKNTPATLYYLPNTTGWSTSHGGRPAVAWDPSITLASSTNLTSGNFKLTITGHTNLPIRIQACESLTTSIWSTLGDTTLVSEGTHTFIDSPASPLSSRFYRITFPQ